MAAIKVLQNKNQQPRRSDVQILLDDLKACSRTRNLGRGKQIHREAVECGHGSRLYVANALINMYAKCGTMVDAREVFDSIKHPDVVSWTVLILGYAQNGQSSRSLELFSRMKNEGLEPDSVSFVAALKACISIGVNEASRWPECRERGKAIHNLVMENECRSNIFLQCTLIYMYAKCGSMGDANDVFDGMKHQTTVSWNTLILGYVDNGEGHTALKLFNRIKTECLAPDPVTFVAALKACTSLAVKEGSSAWMEYRGRGRAIDNLAAESLDIYVKNTLIDLYGKCGSLVDARQVFDSLNHPDIVSWNALILAYADNGEVLTALQMFSRMRSKGPAPDFVTVLAALKACTSLVVKEASSGQAECREIGDAIHSLIMENGWNSNNYVLNSLVNFYVKCGSMVDAHEAFQCIKHPHVVSWTELISGYADGGQGHAALKLFIRMKAEGPAPDSVTFMAALKACALVGALEYGKKIHSEIESIGDPDIVLVTCLVDFYAKCGSLSEAQRVFDMYFERRDLITWNALLVGFSLCGDTEAVFRLFEGMKGAGFSPDGITFLCVLTSCSHAGLVEKGKECFEAMSTKYALIPTLKHYTCMIDICARANKFDAAMAMLECMPCIPDDVTWTTILCACRKWKNVEIGRVAFHCLIKLNDRDAAGYVLMGQIYGSRGMLQEQEMIMGLKNTLKVGKKLGETYWTNEVGEVHKFQSQHPQLHEIQARWKAMSVIMMQHGYVPAEKEESECGHSERLALVCALINTKPEKTIRIVKNQRVCDDCHTVITLLSMLEHRTIICRDESRIHVFKDGKCSCHDFW